ncbi:MAG: peptide chain release factor 2 [Candidatus Anammoxibacter sp.]
MISNIEKELDPLRLQLVNLRDSLDLTKKEGELEVLEEQMALPDFWNDKEKAKEVIKRLKELKEITGPFTKLQTSIDDITLLAEMAEDNTKDAEDLNEEIKTFVAGLRKLEFQLMLMGVHDRNNAYLSIHAGAGGTEACDWVTILLRMYSRWVERHKFTLEIIESLDGDDAGLKRITLHIKGRFAYGYLKSEVGIHRLVRISPFDSNSRRHTSFAAVDVTPEIDDDEEIVIVDNELKVDTYRASGAGGQHVNKTSSAVRITHLPTGIVVQCQNERSQHKNRKMALSMLQAKLYQAKEREKQKERDASYDEKGDIAWGNQIRSYVLQPYTMVKDLRTGIDTSNTQAFLDGEIDEFIESFLKWQIGK